MRARFSLRFMLVAFALLAAALYLHVVRPTALARKFVTAVSRQDFDTARELMIGDDGWSGIVRPENGPKPDRVYAEVMPWEWQDMWRGQRRIVLTIARHNGSIGRNGAYVDWTEGTDLVAGPRGLVEIQSPVNVNFKWPTVAPDTQPAIINPGEGVRVEPNLRTG